MDLMTNSGPYMIIKLICVKNIFACNISEEKNAKVQHVFWMVEYVLNIAVFLCI